MSDEGLFEQVAAVLVDKFEVPAGEVAPEAVLSELGLDSLAVVELLVTLQEEWKVPLEDEEAEGDWTVGTVTELLAGRLASS